MEKSKLELKDTADLMVSSNHGDRLLAEYMQLNMRLQGLKAMLDKWDKAYREGKDIEEVLGFEPTSPFEVLYEQLIHMKSYRRVLRHRMYIEGVSMDSYEEEKKNGRNPKRSSKQLHSLFSSLNPSNQIIS